MKKLITLFTVLMLGFSNLSNAKPLHALAFQDKSHMTKSGKPDKRYNANKHLTKSGKMDMRYKSSKKAAAKSKS